MIDIKEAFPVKLSKRTLSMVLALVVALSATAFGTVAYMTDRASVTNTFTIGSIDITVDESIVDEDGNPITPDNDEDDDGMPEVDLDGDGDPDIEIGVDEDGNIIIDPTPSDDSDEPIVIDPSNPDPTLPDVDGDGKPEIDIDGDGEPDVEVEIDPDTGDIIITPIDPETGLPTDEPIVVDPTPDEPGRTEDGNDYKMVPGKIYTKDPTVTVEKGSEECYVRMRVRINMLDALRAIMTKHAERYDGVPADVALLDQFMVEIDSANWQFQDCWEVTDENGESWMEYEFWHKKADAIDSVKVNAENAAVKVPPLFDEVTVPVWFDNDDLETVDGFKMEAFGDAIQTESFDNDVEAWAAFDDQHGFGQDYE